MNSKEMAAIAGAANAVVRDIRMAVDKVAPQALSPRQRLVRGLLTGSVETALALTHLLAQNDPFLAYPAMALFRPQLEAMARGVFFAVPSASTDDDVLEFLKTDRMPKKPDPDGGDPRRQHLNELLKGTQSVLKKFLPPSLAPMVDEIYSYNLDHFHGFVHGGAKVGEGYEQRGEWLLFSPDFFQLMNIARHSVALAMLAEGVLSAIAYQVERPTDIAPDRSRLVEAYGVLSDEANERYGHLKRYPG